MQIDAYSAIVCSPTTIVIGRMVRQKCRNNLVKIRRSYLFCAGLKQPSSIRPE